MDGRQTELFTLFTSDRNVSDASERHTGTGRMTGEHQATSDDFDLVDRKSCQDKCEGKCFTPSGV